MKLGVHIGYWGMGLGSQDQLEIVQEAERLGYDSVWAAEAYGSDTATVLGWLAGQTSSIRLGAGIFQMPARSAAMTAMTAATIDAYVREMHLGLGCAIENMLTAAGPNGYDAKVEAAEGSLANLAVRRGPVAAASLRLKKRPPSAPSRRRRAGLNSRAKRAPMRARWSSCSTKARIGAHSMRRLLTRLKPLSKTRS